MDAYAPIEKELARLPRQPNLVDYAATCAGFEWSQVRRLLDGLPGGRGLNITHEAVDRHAQGPCADRVALRCIGKTGNRQDISYRELGEQTSRFANALRGLGAGAGETVFVLLGRVPELYVAVLGGLKAKCVVSPLFSAFGPEPIATRMAIGDGRVLVTTEALSTAARSKACAVGCQIWRMWSSSTTACRCRARCAGATSWAPPGLTS